MAVKSQAFRRCPIMAGPIDSKGFTTTRLHSDLDNNQVCARIAAISLLLLMATMASPIQADALSDSAFALLLRPHPPIVVSGDDSWSSAPGVVDGSGTAEDPYRIRGWTILSPGSSGITIANTRKHVLIESNRVTASFFDNDPSFSSAVRLNNVENVTIMNNDLQNSQFGVHIRNGTAIQVSYNRITGLQPPGSGVLVVSNGGVHGIDVRGMLVTDNLISNQGWGITFHGRTTDVNIWNNVVEDTIWSGAVNLLQGVRGVSLLENLIVRSGHGINVIGASDIRIEANTMEDVAVGFDVGGNHTPAGLIPSANVSILKNQVSASEYLGFLAECNTCILARNVFEDSAMGLSLYGDTDVHVELNVFDSNTYALAPAPSDRAVYWHNSILESNEHYTRVVDGTLDLSHNWWGSPDGPSMKKFELDPGAGVIVVPWLLSSPTA